MPSVLDVILMTRMLLHLLEIITISDANIVGTNGLKASVQVWQKKIKPSTKEWDVVSFLNNRQLEDRFFVVLYFTYIHYYALLGWDYKTSYPATISNIPHYILVKRQ